MSGSHKRKSLLLAVILATSLVLTGCVGGGAFVTDDSEKNAWERQSSFVVSHVYTDAVYMPNVYGFEAPEGYVVYFYGPTPDDFYLIPRDEYTLDWTPPVEPPAGFNPADRSYEDHLATLTFTEDSDN
ncbi:MAG: hypothetical protein LBU31_00120 [Coriobacteriales bacterium]|nr:hypothetical protein [Coriobacteriales bacterium]